MAVDLLDFVDTMRREITPLGTALFADITNTALVGYMADAFWEARMDGFFPGFSADEDGVITNTDLTKNISRSSIALIIVYAGIRILRNRILNTQTAFRAKAGPVEFETQSSATMLAEMLKQLRDTKDRLIQNDQGALVGTVMWDWLEGRPEAYRLGFTQFPALGG
jgi:hypothetical protein